jgi:L-asparagine transporter-like permease
VGGIGVIAILILPMVMKKVVPKNTFPFFNRMSNIIFACGILTILLFLFRYSSSKDNILSLYKGLWQRLFMLNTYIYMATIALIMLLKNNHEIPTSFTNTDTP